jgi:spermidine synthase
MKVIARYIGPLCAISIWENERDGSRMYLEGDIFQSHSTQTGDSQFRYVKMMEHFLAPQADILTLGCGGGNLATMLARSGKSVTVVDHNAESIDIARQFFGMPQDIPCVVEDFRTFLASCNRQFGGIAVDVGGPGFCFEEQFDEETCRHIARVLAPGGRTIMNMLVGNDFDGATDRIANLLSGVGRTCWVFDQPGFTNRNALIACLPQSRKEVNRRRIAQLCSADASWMPRRPRQRLRRNPVKIEINCPAYAAK